MIRRVMIAALVFAAPACLVSAQDTKVSVDMIGIGRMSCAHWRSTQAHRLEGTIWVYGFWTGLNLGGFCVCRITLIRGFAGIGFFALDQFVARSKE
jgi:uncharacterized membrane protein